jgi:hypothetical protein
MSNAEKPPKPAGPSPNKINTLMEIAAQKTSGPKQHSLDLGIEKQAEVNGLEMGILKDGTPFLTGRALASLCQDVGDDVQQVGIVGSAGAGGDVAGGDSGVVGEAYVPGLKFPPRYPFTRAAPVSLPPLPSPHHRRARIHRTPRGRR